MSEYLSKDILEECHVKSFAPFRWFQMALGSCRVDARDRFVTAPSVWQKIYSIIISIMAVISYMAFIDIHSSVFLENNRTYFLWLTMLFLHFIISTFNIYHVRFVNQEENVRFYIQMQEIDRIMKIDKSTYFYDLLYKVNLVTVLGWMSAVTVTYVLVLCNSSTMGIYSIGLFFLQISYTLEYLYFSNLILYFYMRLCFINMIIMNHLGTEDDFRVKMYDKMIWLTKKSMRDFAAETNDFFYSDTDVYLKEVFDALRRFTNLYRFQMFLFGFKFVTITLLSVEFFISVLPMGVEIEVQRYITPVVIFGDLVILTFICVRWEEFLKVLSETKHLATTVLSTYTNGPLRKKAVIMLKAIEETPPYISVYDMWHMDSSTLLKILHIITTLTVALLQFAVL